MGGVSIEATEPAQAVEQVACHECDLLMTLKPLTEGQRAQCPRCGNLVTDERGDRYTRAFSFAAAALLLLPIAMSYPFLAFKSSGLENEFKLPQSVEILIGNHGEILGMLMLGFIVVLPAVVLLLVLALVVPLIRDRDAPWLVAVGRMLFGINPWNMVEVFLIGVIVSLVKIMKLATVVIGLSFWAYVAFTICFIGAMAQMDRWSVWQHIERVRRQ